MIYPVVLIKDVTRVKMILTRILVITELQNLTLIEQSYNANSQALRVASEMIDTLLSLTS